MPPTKGSGGAVPLQEGIYQGYEAVLRAGAMSGTPVPPEYAKQMRDAMTIDSMQGQVYSGSIIKCDTQPTAVMQDNVPLETYAKFNMTMDPSVLTRNNQPYKLDQYSIAAQMLAPVPFHVADLNPYSSVELTGGVVAKGRGQQMFGPAVPAESVPRSLEGSTKLDGTITKDDLIPMSETVRKQKREYIKGLQNLGTKYGLDPATLAVSSQVSTTPTISGSAQGTPVPVITSGGKLVTHDNRAISVNVPLSDQSTENIAFGYGSKEVLPRNPIPMVLTSDYPGLSTYKSPYAFVVDTIPDVASAEIVLGNKTSQMRPREETLVRDDFLNNKDATRPTLYDKGVWEQFARAWTAPSKSVQQQVVMGATIALAAIVVGLILWGLIAMSRGRHARPVDSPKRARAVVVAPPVPSAPFAVGKTPDVTSEVSWQTVPRYVQ